MEKNFFPDSQIYIIFGVCIAILSLIYSLSKDRADVSVGVWIPALMIVIPWLHIFWAVFFELIETDASSFEKRLNLIWHLVSVLFVFFLIHAIGPIVEEVKRQDSKKAIIPVTTDTFD